MTEFDHIKKAQNGDQQAFAHLVQKYQTMVFASARHHLNRQEDAQDVAQDVFVNAYENLSSLQDPAKFSSWLRGITANLCKRQWRNRKRIFISYDADTDIEIITDDPTPEEQQEMNDTQNSVNALLNTLSETNRLVLTLHHIDDLPDEEIAHMLGLSPKAVRVRRHRAIKQLQAETITMIKENLTNNLLDNEFTEKVMKRVSLGGIGIGDKHGTLTFNTEDFQYFSITMSKQDAEPISANPKPSLMYSKAPEDRGYQFAIADTPEELEMYDQKPAHDIFDFTKELISLAKVKIHQVILDCEKDKIQATVQVTQNKQSKSIPLNTKDAILLAGRTETPLYATTRVLEEMSFGENDIPPIKKEKVAAKKPNKSKFTWNHYIDQAVKHQADHIYIRPCGETAEILYKTGKILKLTEEAPIEAYHKESDFRNRHMMPPKNTLYIRYGASTYAFTCTTKNEKPDADPTLIYHLRPHPQTT